MAEEVGQRTAAGMQSVDRALQALELLAARGEGGVGEVAEALGVHKSTASRMLATLEAHELVETTDDRGRYRPGFGLVRLASSASGRLDIAKQAHFVTEPLAQDVEETVNFAILSESWAVNVDQAIGPATVSVQNWVGRLTPLHATSNGKVILSRLASSRRDAVLAEAGLEKWTTRTITDRAELEAQLEQVRRQGHAIALGEIDEEINAVAVGVDDLAGNFVGALSISGPAFRFDEAAISACLPRLREAGSELGRRVAHLS
ncbi:IclR family transcriptional regulator [Brevibacterium litoralis]|uniref:IclR family transcriptional regulator n=1 Tax=Brevibacterium litoralis TaxID=3138935 RepID=UPI0032F080AD